MGDGEKTTSRKLLHVVQLVWSAAFLVGGTVIGALVGWQSHGVVGACALGFVGLVAGVFLSNPTLLLQLLR